MNAFITTKSSGEAVSTAEKLEKLFPKFNIKKTMVEKADLIFSIGGDGTLLHKINQYFKHQVPIVGVHAGSVGYLCYIEKRSLEKGLKSILEREAPVTFNTLNVSFGKSKKTAVHDVRIERPTSRAIRMIIKNKDKILAKKHLSDGIIVSGSLGSTAYNLSSGGPILPLGNKDFILTPICPYGLGKHIYDSILKSIIIPDLKLEIIVSEASRLVLDNFEYIIKSKTPVKISKGKEKFKLYIKRK